MLFEPLDQPLRHDVIAAGVKEVHHEQSYERKGEGKKHERVEPAERTKGPCQYRLRLSDRFLTSSCGWVCRLTGVEGNSRRYD